jgi:hypothetical protein
MCRRCCTYGSAGPCPPLQQQSGATCAVGSALQARRWWLEPERARSSSSALPWKQDRAETVGLELAGGGRRSAQQGGVEVGRALSEDAPEWSAAEAMGEERGHGREPNEP